MTVSSPYVNHDFDFVEYFNYLADMYRTSGYVKTEKSLRECFEAFIVFLINPYNLIIFIKKHLWYVYQHF